MRIVGIDPSISGTAIFLHDSCKNTEEFILFGNKKKGKWWNVVEPICRQVVCEYVYPENYSEQDIYKVLKYGQTAELIADTVANFQPDLVVIESYSFSSAAGDIIDLVTFGSALRRSIMNRGLFIKVLAPTQLKSAAGALAYGKDKKGVARRPIREGEKAGLAAGKFTKTEMLESLIHHAPSCLLVKTLGPMAQEAIGLATVPSPINDMVDAYFLAKVSVIER